MEEAQRTRTMQSPMIPVVGDMIRRTPGCISLGQGVVYWGPPDEATDAIGRFLSDSENHKYRPVQGIRPLLEIIEQKLARENGIGLTGRAVVVTAGGNMGFTNAIKAVADPGDE